MSLELSWSRFIVDLFLALLNRAIFLLFSLTAATGLFTSLQGGKSRPRVIVCLAESPFVTAAGVKLDVSKYL